jgi:outer membrane protein TolC
VVLQDVATAVQLSALELVYLRDAIAVTKEHRALLQQTVQLANARYAEDRAKLNDVLKVQSELSQLVYDEILLRELVEVEITKINTLLDQPSANPIELDLQLVAPSSRAPQVEKLEQLALDRRAELAIADAAIEKAEAAIGLSAMRNKPMFSFSAMHVGTGDARMPTADSGKDPFVIGLGMSIPLWREKNRARVKEAELQHDAALEDKRAVENKTRAAVKAAWFRLNNAARLAALYRDSLLPQAKQAMALADQWAERDTRGTVDLAGALETRSTYFNFSLAHLRANADYHQARVRLERLVGGALPQAEEVASGSEASADQAATIRPVDTQKPRRSSAAIPASGISLADYLALLPRHNPAVLAARASTKATLEKLGQAEQLDQILKQYNAFTKQLDLHTSSKGHKEMNAMSFPYPDGMALKGKIISYETKIARLQEATAVRDAVFAAREAWYGLAYVDEAVAVNKEVQLLLEQVISSAQSKVRTGTASVNAVIMAQVELAKIADNLITLDEQRETLKTKLNTLVNLPPDAPIQTLGELPTEDLEPSLEKLYEVALKNRQELSRQRLQITRMRTMAELGVRMANTDASLGASYFENRARLASGSEGPPPFMTRRDVDPAKAPWLGQRNAFVRETQARVVAMREMLRSMEDATRLAVKTAHFGHETAKRSLSLYRDSLLPLARQALEGNTTAFRAGKIDFASFLDSERTLLRFQLEEQKALRTLRTKQALLEKISGATLPAKQTGQLEDQKQ